MTQPHLPTEIIFHILDFVPIDHILPFRAVCHSFQDQIDTHVLYSYLQRTKIIRRLRDTVNIRDDLKLPQVEAIFSHLITSRSSHAREPKWAGKHAVFKLDPVWTEMYRRSRAEYVSSEISKMLAWEPFLWSDIGPWRCPVWLIQLDHAVLDLNFKLSALDPIEFRIDLEGGLVSVEWRMMLKQLLKTEAEITRRMYKYTAVAFGREQDCVRSVRREHYLRVQDAGVSKDKEVVAQKIARMRPLFDSNSRLVEDVNRNSWFDVIENAAMRVIMKMRAEAVRTQKGTHKTQHETETQV